MVNIEPVAVEQFRIKLNERNTPNAYVRFGIRGGGCSGYRFSISYEDEPTERDTIWAVDGVRFVIDGKSAILLSGSTVVWRNSLTLKGFDIVNPNEKSRCGCGRSFSIR